MKKISLFRDSLVASLGLLLGLLLVASLPAGAKPRPTFDRLSVEDGLSHSSVWTISQDHHGFIWIGTQEGLDRYDGHSIKGYKNDADDPHSLSDSEVLSIYLDPQETLWIGTFGGGLNRFRWSDEGFDRFRHDPEDPKSPSADVIHTIYGDDRGRLWIGTAAGLDLVDRERGELRRYGTPVPEAPYSSVYRILDAGAGILWVGTARGLYRFDPAAGTFSAPMFEGSSVSSLLEDPEAAVLFVGTHNGLAAIDRDSGRSVDPSTVIPALEPLTRLVILSVHRDAAGDLWIGTEASGLYRYYQDLDVLREYRHDLADPRSLSSNTPTSIHEDATGVLWFGTYAGVNRFHRAHESFVTYRQSPGQGSTLSGPNIWAVHEDRDGALWIGTYDHGLNRMNRESGEIRHYLPASHDLSASHDAGDLPHGSVSSIIEDHTGTIWVGTWGGLCAFQSEDDDFDCFRHDPAEPQSLGNETILSLVEDDRHEIWVGTWEGVERFDRRRAFARYEPSAEDPEAPAKVPIYSALKDRGGNLWFGSDRAGLYRFDAARRRFTRFWADASTSRSLASDKVAALHMDARGILWIGYYGAGLSAFDPENGGFRHWRQSYGLPSDTVLGILEGDGDDLWLSTSNGLSRFDPSRETFRNFVTGDGIQGNVFSTGSAFKNPRSGELFFGGVHGLTAFLPERIAPDPHPPQVAITELKLFNEPVALRHLDPESPLRSSILETLVIELSHRDYVFSFEFAALHFANPGKNRYAYKLTGFDRDWYYTDSRRPFAQYSNLDPGSYKLVVKAASSDGVWNDEGKTLEIIVRPAPWKSWWAYTIYALSVIAAAGVFLWDFRRKRERRVRRAMDRERLIRELEEKNAELERFTYTVSHDLKSPLVTIQGFIGLAKKDARANNLGRLDEDFHYIENAVDKMRHLLDDLLELSRIGRKVNPPEPVALAELARKAVDLVAGRITEAGMVVKIEEPMPIVFGDRVRLLEVFQNLVDNAAKFMDENTSSPRLEIGCDRNGGEAICYVRDNGMGIDPQFHEKVFGLFDRLDPDDGKGTGIGLALVKRIVEVHGGRIWVDSPGVGHGSTFYFTLPVYESMPGGQKPPVAPNDPKP